MANDQYRYGRHYGSLRFWVEIKGIEIGGFAECSGLSVETEMHEYSEGGWNAHTYKLPTRLKHSNVTLRRGLNEGGELRTWFEEGIYGVPASRHDVTITLYDPEGKKVSAWQLKDAYPVKYVAPEFKTEAGAVAVESVEIAHHGLQRAGAGGGG